MYVYAVQKLGEDYAMKEQALFIAFPTAELVKSKITGIPTDVKDLQDSYLHPCKLAIEREMAKSDDHHGIYCSFKVEGLILNIQVYKVCSV